MQKVLISIEGPGHSGKSTVLHQVAVLFSQRLALSASVHGKPNDQVAIFELTECRFGIATKGEPAETLVDRLQALRSAGCHVLLCAPRTNARKAVVDWAYISSYRVLHWSALSSKWDHDVLNAYAAERLVELVDAIASGELRLSSFDRDRGKR